MARRKIGERTRLVLTGGDFEGAAQEYRAALSSAEKLWRRLERRRGPSDLVEEDRARRELARVEERLDRARSALLEHTKKATTDPKRTRVKRLGLGARDVGAA